MFINNQQSQDSKPITPLAVRLAKKFMPGPLTLVVKAKPNLPKALTANSGKIAFRISGNKTANALAKELGRPIIVHSRNAEERCIQILENEMIEKVIMHCFCGTSLLVRRIVENSWFLSIPTSVCYKEWFQQVIKETPIENLLCETDSPYLHPEKKGENSPAHVLSVYKKIAEIKNLDLKIIERKIENNYNSLFS